MKKIIASLVVAGLVGMSLTAAADIPPSWTGFSTGINGGYGWGNPSNFNQSLSLPYPSLSGGFAGGQLGFDWQLGNWIVVGLGLGIDWSDLSGANSTNLITGAGANDTDLSASEQITWAGDLLPRIGVLALDNLLIYGAGGLAFGHGQGQTSAFFNTTTLETGSYGQTEPGWAAGGGLEWMVIPHWSLGAEYIYNQLNNVTLTTNTPTISSQRSVAVNAYQLAEFFINYRF